MQGVGTLARHIYAAEGVRGLMRGATARVVKVAPSCAIMISIYEVLSKHLSD